MTLIEFVNEYFGKEVDFDGHYGAQCVDLFRQYYTDVLGIKEHTGAVEGAKDLVEKYYFMTKEKKYFELVKDRYSGREGDVAVWGMTATNPFGHVAIVLARKPKSLIVFEQNGFKQGLGARLNERPLENVIGYLRARAA